MKGILMKRYTVAFTMLLTFALLFGLMLFATYNDIIRLVTGAL